MELFREVGISFTAAAQHQITNEASKDGFKVCLDYHPCYTWLKLINFDRTQRRPSLFSVSDRGSISYARTTTRLFMRPLIP